MAIWFVAPEEQELTRSIDGREGPETPSGDARVTLSALPELTVKLQELWSAFDRGYSGL